MGFAPFTSHIFRRGNRFRMRRIRRVCSAVASNLLFCNARTPRFSLHSGWLAFPSIRRRNVGNIRSSLFPPSFEKLCVNPTIEVLEIEWAITVRAVRPHFAAFIIALQVFEQNRVRLLLEPLFALFIQRFMLLVNPLIVECDVNECLEWIMDNSAFACDFAVHLINCVFPRFASAFSWFIPCNSNRVDLDDIVQSLFPPSK